jgi:hypothetical protein
VELICEKLELERRRYAKPHGPTSENTEPRLKSNEIQPMTEEEKTELLRELLLPKDEAGTLRVSEGGEDSGKSGAKELFFPTFGS